ncbi:MAG: AarF/ABC1/UbiB kinase family protein, partial [Pacificimonas sp.]
ARHMPPTQLNKILIAEWGRDWRQRFKSFTPRPIAAASIGQVHKGVLPDGREVAVKVQYPGVAKSIDSDIDNVATLLRVSGALPKELDLGPLLEEAKRQLHEEADYEREAGELARFHGLLADDDRYVVPEPLPEFSSRNILAMTFAEGVAIETLENDNQHNRDAVMASLIDLVLRELFVFGHMQTDPNFANYRWQQATGKLVLLDFGASRAVAPATADAYRKVVAALFDGDREGVKAAALEAGFMNQRSVDRHGPLIGRMIDIVIGEFEKDGPFDFGDRAFVATLREEGMAIGRDREAWHIPPIDTLFTQRKISGTALLAARLKARVDVRTLVAKYV